MTRKLIINLHLFLAAFFIPVVLVVTTSGALYLLDFRGDMEKIEVYRGTIDEFDFAAKDINLEVEKFLAAKSLDYDFEYVVGGSQFKMTRPTSRTHLTFQAVEQQLIVTQRVPNLVASIIELHKGHGPGNFKIYQILMAAGLIFILVSGFYLGLNSSSLRRKTMMTSLAGTFTLLALILF